MNKKVVVTVSILFIGVLLMIGSFFLLRSIHRKNNIINNNQVIDNEKIKEELIDSELQIFLDSISGDYLAKNDSGDGVGIIIRKQDNKYTYLSYLLNSEYRNAGIITKVNREGNNRYILTVYYSLFSNEAYLYPAENWEVIMDVSKIEDGKIRVDSYMVYNDKDKYNVKVSREYSKFWGEFTEWDKKKAFVEKLK